MKRIGLYLLTNILVLTTIVIATSVLGVNRYLDAQGSILSVCWFLLRSSGSQAQSFLC